MFYFHFPERIVQLHSDLKNRKKHNQCLRNVKYYILMTVSRTIKRLNIPKQTQTFTKVSFGDTPPKVWKESRVCSPADFLEYKFHTSKVCLHSRWKYNTYYSPAIYEGFTHFLFVTNHCIWCSLPPLEVGVVAGLPLPTQAWTAESQVGCPLRSPQGTIGEPSSPLFSLLSSYGRFSFLCKPPSHRKMWQFKILPKSWGENRKDGQGRRRTMVRTRR